MRCNLTESYDVTSLQVLRKCGGQWVAAAAHSHDEHDGPIKQRGQRERLLAHQRHL